MIERARMAHQGRPPTSLDFTIGLALPGMACLEWVKATPTQAFDGMHIG